MDDRERLRARPRGAERRRHPRAAAEEPARISVDGVGREVQLRDISASGVCFFTDAPVPEWTRVALELDLPVGGGRARVRAEGAVVRCARVAPALAHYEVAVFLQDVDEPGRGALTRYVDERVQLGV